MTSPSDRASLLHQNWRPRLLDAFCCEGGAGMGYHRAGFSVVGIDINDHADRYPFEFHQEDALESLRGMAWSRRRGQDLGFDAVHASPPCQSYLNLGKVNKALGRDYDHPDLVAETRELLNEIGLPWVMENVPGAPLINPVRLCGTSFGLPLRRHRYFESNVPLVGTQCAHHLFTEKRYWTGWRPKGEHRLSTVVQVYGNAADKHEWPAAMGIDWMTNDGMAEAIPPAYTEHIGAQLMRAVVREEAAA
jgi:DNA (cytosine-5)-methyltransferase 1